MLENMLSEILTQEPIQHVEVLQSAFKAALGAMDPSAITTWGGPFLISAVPIVKYMSSGFAIGGVLIDLYNIVMFILF